MGAAPLPYWKYALPAAILGAILGSFVLYIPNRYVSTAVLRLAGADPRSPDSVQAAAGHMPEMFRPVLSRDSLAEIIQRPTLQLYAQERARRSLDEVVKQMRERDLRVELLRDSPFGGRPTAFRISFAYSDRAKADESVQAVVHEFVEAVPLKHGAGLAPHVGPGHLHLSANGLLVGPAAELFANSYFPERDIADLLDNRIVEGGGDSQPAPAASYLEALDLNVYEVPVNFPMWGSRSGLAGCPERRAADMLHRTVGAGGDGAPTQGAPSGGTRPQRVRSPVKFSVSEFSYLTWRPVASCRSGTPPTCSTTRSSKGAATANRRRAPPTWKFSTSPACPKSPSTPPVGVPSVASPACCWASPSRAHAAPRFTPRRRETRHPRYRADRH